MKLKGKELRRMLGLQFFAEPAEGSESGTEWDDFGAALDADDEPEGAEPEGNEPGAEPEPPQQPPEPETPPEGDAGQTGGAGGGQEPPQPQPEAMTAVDLGGQLVQLPAGALAALSAALGTDAGAMLRAGAQAAAGERRETGILREYAQIAGMELGDYLQYLEQNSAAQAEANEMARLREQWPQAEEALLRGMAQWNVSERREAAARQQADARAAEAARTAQQRQQETVQEIQSFMRLNPEIKGKGDVPQAVWDKVTKDGLPLGIAYERYKAEQAAAEAAKLREQLAVQTKNQSNRQQSAGSMLGAGDDGLSEFERILLS